MKKLFPTWHKRENGDIYGFFYQIYDGEGKKIQWLNILKIIKYCLVWYTPIVYFYRLKYKYESKVQPWIDWKIRKKKNDLYFIDKYKNIFPKNGPSCGFYCPEGWLELVDGLCEKLNVLEKPPLVEQVKQKYGGLRFYISNASEKAYEIINEYENRAESICEFCGSMDNVTKSSTNWIFTVCTKCKTKLKNKTPI